MSWRRGFVIVYGVLIATVSAWRVALLIPREMDLGVLINGLAAFAESGPSGVIPYLGFGIWGSHMEVATLAFVPLIDWPVLPYLLVTAQAASVAWAVLQIAQRTQRHAADSLLAVIVPVAVAFHPAVLYALFFDVHANVMSLGFLTAFVIAVQEERWRRAVVFGLIAALFREDIAVVVALITILRWSRIPSPERLALTTVPLGLIISYLSQGGNDFGRNNLFGYLDPSEPARSVATALELFFENGWIVAVVVIVATPLALLGNLDWRVLVPALMVSFPIAFGAVAGGRTVAYHYYAIVVVSWALALRFEQPPKRVVGQAAIAITAVWIVLGPLGTSAFSAEPVMNTVPQIVASAQTNGSGRYGELRAALDCVADVGPITVSPEVTPHTAGRTDLYLYPQPFAEISVQREGGGWIYPTADLGPPVAIVALTPIQISGYQADLHAEYVYWLSYSGHACGR